MTDQSRIDAYRAAVTTCVLAAQLLATHDLPAMLEAIERAEAVGAMLEDKAVLEAATPLYRLGRKLAQKGEVAGG